MRQKLAPVLPRADLQAATTGPFVQKDIMLGRIADAPDAVTLSASHQPDIRFEFPVGGKPEIENHDFAVWALMPLAMLRNVDLRIEGRVSERAIASAELISDIWEKWRPAIFHRVRISADETFSERRQSSRTLSFFSGGVDSTYSPLRSLREEGEKSDCLSLHGMDYRYEDQENFDKLLAKTRPFTDAHCDKAHVVRTTLGQVYFRHFYQEEIRRSFSVYMMMACASFYNDYDQYRIAADHRIDQQYWCHPYGNSTGTNRLIKSANADLATMHDDVARSDKVRYLHDAGLDLSTLSVCPDKSVQPKNCGVCGKCIRTKVMFQAATGQAPDIFLDQSIPADWPKHVDLSEKCKAIYMHDMLSVIEDNGDPQAFPGYEAARQKYLAKCEQLLSPTLYNMPWRESVRYLTPKPVLAGVRRLKRLVS